MKNKKQKRKRNRPASTETPYLVYMQALPEAA